MVDFYFSTLGYLIELKNITLQLALPTRSRCIMETQFFPCPISLEVIKGKLVHFFWSSTKSNHPHVIICYCSHLLCFEWNLPGAKTPGAQNYFFRKCRKHWLSYAMVNLLLSSTTITESTPHIKTAG